MSYIKAADKVFQLVEKNSSLFCGYDGKPVIGLLVENNFSLARYWSKQPNLGSSRSWVT